MSESEPVEVVEVTPIGNGHTAVALRPLDFALVDSDQAGALAAVDARMAFLVAVRQRTVRVTLPQDWVDMDGKPYLQATGVERVGALWGIYLRHLTIHPDMDETRRRLRNGEHVTVQVTGTVGSRVTGVETDAFGSRSSDDPFFANRRGGIETLDPADLQKAAISNFEVNGIMRAVGLRGLAWDDLAAHGITRDGKATTVTYRDSGQTGGDQAATGLATEIQTGLETLYGANALEALKTLTSFKGKDGKTMAITSWDYLHRKAGEKWLARIVKDVRKELASAKPGEVKPAPAQAEVPF